MNGDGAAIQLRNETLRRVAKDGGKRLSEIAHSARPTVRGDGHLVGTRIAHHSTRPHRDRTARGYNTDAPTGKMPVAR